MVEATQERQRTEVGSDGPPHRSHVFEVKWRNPERGLLDYAAAVWTRKYTVLLTTLVMGVSGMLYALSKPNTYASRARLMVHGTEVGSSAADAAASMLGTGRILPDQVVTAVEIIRSRVVLGRLVDRFGYEQVLAPYQPGASGTPTDGKGVMDRVVDAVHYVQAKFLIGGGMDFSRFSEQELRDIAIEVVEDNLTVIPATRGTTMELSYLHTSPDAAQEILAAIVDESIKRYGEVVAPPAGKDFLDSKLQESVEELAAARSALRAFGDANGTTDFTEQIKVMTKRLGDLRGQLGTARGTLIENEQVIKELRAQLEPLRPTIEEETQRVYGPDPAAQAIRQQIATLESQLAREETESTPQSIRLAAQVRKLRGSLADLGQVEPSRTIAVRPNPKYVSISDDLRRREVASIGAREQVPVLEKSVKELQKELESMRGLQSSVSALHDRVEEAEAANKRLRDTSKAYEISSELDTRGLSNLRRVEPAVYPRQKEGPQRGKLMLVVAALGFAGCVTFLLVRVRLSRHLVRHTDVAFALGRSDVVSMPSLNQRNLQRFEEARRRGWE